MAVMQAGFWMRIKTIESERDEISNPILNHKTLKKSATSICEKENEMEYIIKEVDTINRFIQSVLIKILI